MGTMWRQFKQTEFYSTLVFIPNLIFVNVIQIIEPNNTLKWHFRGKHISFTEVPLIEVSNESSNKKCLCSKCKGD